MASYYTDVFNQTEQSVEQISTLSHIFQLDNEFSL